MALSSLKLSIVSCQILFFCHTTLSLSLSLSVGSLYYLLHEHECLHTHSYSAEKSHLVWEIVDWYRIINGYLPILLPQSVSNPRHILTSPDNVFPHSQYLIGRTYILVIIKCGRAWTGPSGEIITRIILFSV